MSDAGLKWLKTSSVVVSRYDPSLLQPISRAMSRDALGPLTCFGMDVWNAYEVSYLQPSGLPKVAVLSFVVDAHSPNVIESKSLKLYLNALNNHVFNSEQALYDTLHADLSATAGAQIDLHISTAPFEHSIPTLSLEHWDSLDDLKPADTVMASEPKPSILAMSPIKERVSKKLYTRLFRANCLVTNQPDWATVMIEYEGFAWDHEALLAYLISYRNHQGFHEQCIDRMFIDIMTALKPSKLWVQANFTRRGGIDITPVRSTQQSPIFKQGRDWRQ